MLFFSYLCGMEKILYIVRGIPGSGKSTFAKNLAQKFPKDTVLIIAQDAYYKDLNTMSLKKGLNEGIEGPATLIFLSLAILNVMVQIFKNICNAF